jgi:hypothetical protein
MSDEYRVQGLLVSAPRTGSDHLSNTFLRALSAA